MTTLAVAERRVPCCIALGAVCVLVAMVVLSFGIEAAFRQSTAFWEVWST